MTRAIISLILLLHWSQGAMGGDDVVQEPKILWKPKGNSANMNCTHTMGTSYFQMYWYRQRPGETMRLIVLTIAGSDPDFGDVDKDKFEAHKSVADRGSLIVKDLEPEDSAIYFCSVSRGNQYPAYFGSGTKLTVLDPKIKVSEEQDLNVTIIKPSEKESCKKTVTLVCVAKDFYPDHVSITWMVGGKPRTEGVATDPNAFREQETEHFTISSRLKVPRKEWNNEKTEFKCTLKFYDGKDYLYKENKVNGIAGSGYTREDYVKSSQMIKLSYGVFIAKSALYGLVIFVYVWRKGSGK